MCRGDVLTVPSVCLSIGNFITFLFVQTRQNWNFPLIQKLSYFFNLEFSLPKDVFTWGTSSFEVIFTTISSLVLTVNDLSFAFERFLHAPSLTTACVPHVHDDWETAWFLCSKGWLHGKYELDVDCSWPLFLQFLVSTEDVFVCLQQRSFLQIPDEELKVAPPDVHATKPEEKQPVGFTSLL